MTNFVSRPSCFSSYSAVCTWMDLIPSHYLWLESSPLNNTQGFLSQPLVLSGRLAVTVAVRLARLEKTYVYSSMCVCVSSVLFSDCDASCIIHVKPCTERPRCVIEHRRHGPVVDPNTHSSLASHTRRQLRARSPRHTAMHRWTRTRGFTPTRTHNTHACHTDAHNAPNRIRQMRGRQRAARALLCSRAVAVTHPSINHVLAVVVVVVV